jgi:hypothetical protein
MAGYGAAKDWGPQLAVDFADWKAGLIPWSNVDRSLLLSGPPGVVSLDETTVQKYLTLFKRIFYETDHGAHYEMMYGLVSATADEEASLSKPSRRLLQCFDASSGRLRKIRPRGRLK